MFMFGVLCLVASFLWSCWFARHCHRRGRYGWAAVNGVMAGAAYCYLVWLAFSANH